jgi:hypothetical protein
MNCPYRNTSYPICGLGLYGGMPSIGICKLCVKQNENNIEHAQTVLNKNNKDIQPVTQIKTLAKALTKWSLSKFEMAEPPLFNQRISICKSCPEWDESGFVNTGRCKKCGCSTQAKLRMATEKCPIGKW